MIRLTHSTPSFDCPRRGDMALWGASNDDWAEFIERMLDPESHPCYRDDGSVIPPQDGWRNDGTCSYCGGLSPERLFACIGNGCELVPTDKNYKVYVERRNNVGDDVGGKLYTVHLNRENAAKLRDLITSEQVTIGFPGHFYNGLWLAPAKADPETDAAPEVA